jgi:2-keto-4-pentenoate hydratase
MPPASGTGAGCLGGPLNAAEWLASTVAAMGDPLCAGDVLLTGALGPVPVAAPDDAFHARSGALGTVGVRFAPDPKTSKTPEGASA